MTSPIIAERASFHYVQLIEALPARMFALLCPEREKEWVPGWTAHMIHSASGLVENAAVFATPGTAGDTLWYTVTHIPLQQVRFVRFQPEGVLVDIDIHVQSAGELRSQVDIRYTFTATSAQGAASVRSFTQEHWLEMMTEWQNDMNRWLAQNPDR